MITELRVGSGIIELISDYFSIQESPRLLFAIQREGNGVEIVNLVGKRGYVFTNSVPPKDLRRTLEHCMEPYMVGNIDIIKQVIDGGNDLACFAWRDKK